MQEVIEHGYEHVPEADLQAIAVYLESLPPVRNDALAEREEHRERRSVALRRGALDPLEARQRFDVIGVRKQRPGLERCEPERAAARRAGRHRGETSRRRSSRRASSGGGASVSAATSAASSPSARRIDDHDVGCLARLERLARQPRDRPRRAPARARAAPRSPSPGRAPRRAPTRRRPRARSGAADRARSVRSRRSTPRPALPPEPVRARARRARRRVRDDSGRRRRAGRRRTRRESTRAPLPGRADASNGRRGSCWFAPGFRSTRGCAGARPSPSSSARRARRRMSGSVAFATSTTCAVPRRALDDDLHRAQHAAVRALRVGARAGGADRLAQRRGDLVHQRVVHATAGDVDDVVGSRREDPDLRASARARAPSGARGGGTRSAAPSATAGGGSPRSARDRVEHARARPARCPVRRSADSPDTAGGADRARRSTCEQRVARGRRIQCAARLVRVETRFRTVPSEARRRRAARIPSRRAPGPRGRATR